MPYDYKTYSVMPSDWLKKSQGQNYEGEKALYRSLITENFNKTGVNLVYYVTSFDTSFDKIFGEDNDRRFVRRFNCMGKYTLVSEEKVWTRFAIEGLDTFSVFISKDHFRAASTYGFDVVPGNLKSGEYDPVVPRVGDVIQSVFNSYLYEITAVKEEIFMMHQDKHYVWELVVSPFKNEHLSLDSATSADMGDIIPYISASDTFNIKDYITSADAAVEFSATGQESPRDPFGGW